MIFINILIMFIYVLFWFKTKNYQKETVDKLDEKVYKLKQLFPLGLYLLDKVSDLGLLHSRIKRSSRLDDKLKSLYVGEEIDEVKRYYRCNKITLVVVIIFATNVLSLFSNISSLSNAYLQDGNYINRPGHNEGTKDVSLNVHISEDDSTILEDEITVPVKEKRYKEEEVIQIFADAKKYIDSKILGQNKSADNINTNLDLVTKIPESAFSVEWSTSDNKLLDEKGNVHNDTITETALVSVTAVITYYDNKEEYTRYVRILPKEYTKEELARKSLSDALDSMDEQSKTQDKITLPSTLGKLNVSWAQKEDTTGLLILCLGVLSAVLIGVVMDKELSDKVEKRNREMLLDYPEVINKFTLLVSAGMSLSNAWCKMCQDYKEKNEGKRYVYEEMMLTYGELMIGTSETTAYERFGRRVKLIPYLRFSSMIAQNVKKGSVSLFEALELEVIEAFEERKELAKRMGEEAGTKLLGPMVVMLLIVLAIIMVPAFLSFGI